MIYLRAAVLDRGPNGQLDLHVVEEIPLAIPVEESTKVLVAVKACGICGTDLHILNGEAYQPQLPFVLGHEPAGVVVQAYGEQGMAWVGKRVVPAIFQGCGHCHECQQGDERLCLNLQSITGVMGHWGGFASHILLDVSQLIEIPFGLSDIQAAALVDSGASAFNACRKVLPGFTGRVAIVGGGPVGMVAAETLRARSIAPMIVEQQTNRLQWFKNQGYETVSEMEHVPSNDFDCVIDCAGTLATLKSAPRCLRPKGLFIVVGYKQDVPTDFSLIARKELTVQGVRSGTKSDLLQVMDLSVTGSISPLPLSVWNLADITKAIESLRSGHEPGKVVIDSAS